MSFFREKRKSLLLLLLSVSFYVVTFIPLTVSAIDTTYIPLAPLTDAQETMRVRPSTYIVDLFKILIGVASGLAVLVIAYGGIQYMLSDVVTDKSKAKEHIRNALLGLLLAISSYLILNTIGGSKLVQPTILQNLDVSPAATPGFDPSAGGTRVLRIQAKVSLKKFQLLYRAAEYQLSYTTNNGTRLMERYANETSCDAAKTELQGGAINRLLTWISGITSVSNVVCDRVVAKVRTGELQSGFTYAPGYAIPLSVGARYQDVLYTKQKFGTESECIAAKEIKEDDPAYFLGTTNPCGEVGEDYETKLFSDVNECTSWLNANKNTLFVVQGMTVKPVFIFTATDFAPACKRVWVTTTP